MEIDDKAKDRIRKVLDYIDKITRNGQFAIISALFQLEFQIIKYLSDKENVHPSDLASYLKVTRPNIATNLKSLEQKGYITRQINKDNRRQIYVNLTTKGKKFYSICQLQLDYLFTSWFSILGEEEIKHLFNILELSSNPDLVTEKINSFKLGIE